MDLDNVILKSSDQTFGHSDSNKKSNNNVTTNFCENYEFANILGREYYIILNIIPREYIVI